MPSTPPVAADELVKRRLDFLKLLRLEPAITTATLVDSHGREQLRVRSKWRGDKQEDCSGRERTKDALHDGLDECINDVGNEALRRFFQLARVGRLFMIPVDVLRVFASKL